MSRTVLFITIFFVSTINTFAQEVKEVYLPQETYVSIALMKEVSTNPQSPNFIRVGEIVEARLWRAVLLEGRVIAMDWSKTSVKILESWDASQDRKGSRLVLEVGHVQDSRTKTSYKLMNIKPLVFEKKQRDGSILLGHGEVLWFQTPYRKHFFPQDHFGFIQPMIMQRNYGWSLVNLNFALKDYGDVMFLSFGIGAGVRKAGPHDRPISQGTFIGTFYPVSIRMSKLEEGSTYFNLGVVREFATKDWGFIGGVSFHFGRP